MPWKLIDAHVHVWAPVEDARAGKYPYYVRFGTPQASDRVQARDTCQLVTLPLEA